MARQVLIPHAIGWSKAAAELQKKAAKTHRENRKKMVTKILKEHTRSYFESSWDLIKREARNPWNLFPPILVMKFVIVPLQGIGNTIGHITSAMTKLLAERRKSLAVKKSAVRMIGYAILEEMQRDPAYKAKIAALVDEKKGKGLKWLYITKGGKVLLSSNPAIANSTLDHPVRVFEAPRVDMEVMVKRANMNFVAADGLPTKMSIALRGDELHLSVQKPVKGSKDPVYEVLRKEDTEKTMLTKSVAPKKARVTLLMKNGSIRSFVVDEDEAVNIYNRMKK